MLGLTDAEHERITTYIKVNYGIDLNDKKVFIESRIGQMVLNSGFNSYSDYFDSVLTGGKSAELEKLVNKLTTNHTFFMREIRHFEVLRDLMLKDVDQNSKDYNLRIWSAACSSGEEPYTIAMYVADYFGSRTTAWTTQILATDLSTDVLKKAQAGVFPAQSISQVPLHWQETYFSPTSNGNCVVSDKIKNMVFFRRFNLISSRFPFQKKFHIIFCRNVMIYFDIPTREKLIQNFYDFLEPGGYLIIGHSESFPRKFDGFEYVETSIYRKVSIENER